MSVAVRSSAALYTPELLGLAVRLAECPLQEDHPLKGQARSRTCGSVVAASLAVNEGRVAALGMRVSACAVGQAAAAIFAGSAKGQTGADLRSAADGIEAWLTGEGPMPDWPDLTMLEPALPHSGRHGAILLPWKAALDALCKTGPAD